MFAVLLDKAYTFLMTRPAVVRIIPIVIGVLVLIILGLVGLWQFAALQRDRIKVKYDQLSAKVDLQNSEIERWKKDASDQAAKVKKAQEEAARIRANSTRLLEIQAATLPKECPDAVEWGLEEAVKIAGGER